ncbi:7-cyano-7-deazaguanine/7-aminomethyl-7-deazaguanine transporter [Kingella negevensis]|uniref:7-cyano-7-deazaguanine/7-aminomethyl-7- deazaguanine transporter n=1 Tax=Kingella negevensis TaxID=1522312 RepID=UPI00254E4AAF|nr:7-cyano-7-deazaguanine/7-aminomethyl-7-deazaguanine transporter [Kingella negevensis]MDK4679209.1 7-cyano-7-deazaguanine/7-aminomethyl-7-deazaguanine transporter [Kingella negevensis]MDK4683069.1 7-cyano-7-deazaguanine/7-aminomethyl-7-deazaguanine transporter [Kingella negevensis]MDK4691269.1 7-cyano-7-deazaguanine/7-aminomethyl-7-deazaguanine transporter [Kingella negevensis]MDK4693583.1 7-cyano-7-deazaguanine/7-aminomethyl-7-deazaguanine transporter [Kingella negevensis]MDK4700399.1 7-cya
MQTYLFTDKQKSKALFWLVLFHILVITSSNYLVQFPFSITLPNGFEVHSTWGALTFPFIFLATDLTVRIFGKQLARRIIFFVMFPALIISYALSVLFAEGQWTGWQSLTTFSMFVFRIALASFSAYLFGQIMDIFVFNKLRSLKSWWIAPTASMFMGNAMDTIIFFFVAFYASSDSFMAANWTHIAFVDYLFKLVICMGLFLPAYGVLLNMIMKKLSQFVQTQQLTAVEQN